MTSSLLFVMELKTRRVHFAGCTPDPDAHRRQQVARNLTDSIEDVLLGKRYVLMDRDGKFCPPFRNTLQEAGAQVTRLPPRSRDLNAYLERFLGSLKSQSLNRMIVFGEKSLRRAVTAYLKHYHTERNHQRLGNRPIKPAKEVGAVAGRLECRQRLGGMLQSYYRDAA